MTARKFSIRRHKPELVVCGIGLVFILVGAVLEELLPADVWIFPMMLVIWGVGAIVNSAIEFGRAVNTR